MEFYPLLLLGGLIGMQHAFEADHLAAVAALSESRSSRRALILRGSIWGLGHTITLLTICGALLLLGETIKPHTEAMLEFAVGVMIILLGINVLYKVWRRRPHFHIHEHDAGEQHMHVHLHEGNLPHSESRHSHEHYNLGLRRALLVGVVHGAAGSAGLLILAAAANSVPQAIGYVLAFGAGSILGMAALTFVVSYPLRWMERCANWVNTTTFVGIGCAAIFVGGTLLSQSWSVL
ncbi:MAG: sulfite exporter TauE/SafE family protein [Gammaproteobacteria bacterium]|nr:sulfite exporter TauE/SafE family protein [Gammaproteobacteria bacterium]MDH3430427.1 sulfite exporter TauE/SafE family protein [Gammaproteobacteria bacterium]MDH3434459.1 sulfite exporter TauE/SafE family protein [Gammaproteobacteria bacterium]